MRRPVRVSALSLSLQAPLETVRRRVALQCREGVCLMTPDGVIVPTATTNSPPYRQALNAQWDMLQALYAHLLALGFLGPPSHAPRLKSEPAPVRLAGRYVVEFALRFTESYLRFLPSPVDVLISMEIHQLNAEHLPGAKGGTAGLGDFGSPSDAWRGPASTRRISEALGMPYETVRRHLERLVAEGHVRKQGRGYAPAAEVFTNPAYLQLLDENNAHLTHLFAALDHHGLAGVWAARSAGASGDTG
jgi:hypothetical protein